LFHTAIMDFLLSLKPTLTALVLPAASAPLLLLIACIRGWRRMFVLTWVLLWLCSCQAVAVWLSLHLLPQVKPITGEDLKRNQVQAIVVLGGGVNSQALEYGQPTLAPEAMARLLYGDYLSRSGHLPIAYSGGKGWAAPQSQATEAEVANLSLARLGAAPLKWQEDQSRDTRENARLTAALLQPEGIHRIALVTHAWHMPRSVKQFESAGFYVLPAPMGYLNSDASPWLQWIPSGHGLRDTSLILREWLGLLLIH
jgi:uncharacterized SAM-binding protein YcdF (DUF218 family)